MYKLYPGVGEGSVERKETDHEKTRGITVLRLSSSSCWMNKMNKNEYSDVSPIRLFFCYSFVIIKRITRYFLTEDMLKVTDLVKKEHF